MRRYWPIVRIKWLKHICKCKFRLANDINFFFIFNNPLLKIFHRKILIAEIVNALPISIENNKSLDSSENTSNGNELNNFLLSLIIALIVAAIVAAIYFFIYSWKSKKKKRDKRNVK